MATLKAIWIGFTLNKFLGSRALWSAGDPPNCNYGSLIQYILSMTSRRLRSFRRRGAFTGGVAAIRFHDSFVGSFLIVLCIQSLKDSLFWDRFYLHGISVFQLFFFYWYKPIRSQKSLCPDPKKYLKKNQISPIDTTPFVFYMSNKPSNARLFSVETGPF